MKLTPQAEVDLSEFFDGHPVATFAINRHHVITHWNRACEQLLGWTRLHGRHAQPVAAVLPRSGRCCRT
jgi:PAS domain-containing protein